MFWKSLNTPKLFPDQPNFDQYYSIGMNDLGQISGFVTYYDGNDKGFLFDTTRGEVLLNDTYSYGDMNNDGTMLRQISDYNNPAHDTIEVVVRGTPHALPIPANLRGMYSTLDPRIGASGRVTAFLGDDDIGDGCSGCGSSCVRWDPPNYQPVVFNPAGFGSRDYCSPGRPNVNGDTLVAHGIWISGDDYRSVNRVILDNTYYDLLAICPELARYEYYYTNAINDRQQIVGTGRRDGRLRGFILKRIQ